MRKILILIILCLPFLSYSQQKYYIRTDSLVVEKINGAAELILRNATRDSTNGILVNIGSGRTRFIRAKVLNDSTFTIGTDTIVLRGGVGGPGGGATDLDKTLAATTVTVTSNTGTDAIVPGATHSLAGVMTAADKMRLDSNFFMRNGIAPGDSIMVALNDSTAVFKRLIAGNNMSFTITANAIQINGPSAGTTETANEGLIKSATNIQLGNADGSTTSQFSTDRTVPLGGRTLTFLSGRISIRSSASTIAPLLLRNDGGANGLIWEIDRTGQSISNDLFTNPRGIVAYYNNLQPSEPDSINDNFTWTRGYNLLPGGGRVDVNKPQMVEQDEQNFIIGGYGRSIEKMWAATTANGWSSRPIFFWRSWWRPFSALTFQATNYAWKDDSTGLEVMSLNKSGILDIYSSDPTAFPSFRSSNRAGSASPTILHQYNAAGNNYLPVIGYDNDSVLAAGYFSAGQHFKARNYVTGVGDGTGYNLGDATGLRGGLRADHSIGSIELWGANNSFPLIGTIAGTEHFRINNTNGFQFTQLTGTGEGMGVLNATGVFNRINGTTGQVPTKQADGTIIFATPSGATYTFSGSLVDAAGTVTLVNDNATPGNSKYYGTDGSGTKGFFSLPGGSGNAWTYDALNSPGATGLLGTADNNHISISTNNTYRGAWLNNGQYLYNVAIGAHSADYSYQIGGNVNISGAALSRTAFEVSSTVTATANSQTLTGLQISPNFATGGFTGLIYRPLYINGSAAGDIYSDLFNNGSGEMVLRVVGATGGMNIYSDRGLFTSGIDFNISSGVSSTINFNRGFLNPIARMNATGFYYEADYNMTTDRTIPDWENIKTATQTFTNKTLTAPQINGAKLETSSTVGHVWTASGTDGAGAWSAPTGFTPVYATYLLVVDKPFSAATTAEVITLDTEETESGITHTGSSEEITFPNAGVYNISSDISAFSSSVDVVKWAIQKWDGDSWELVANSGSLVSIPATSMTFGGTQTFQITMATNEKIRFISTATSTNCSLNAIAAADGAAAIPAFRVRINKIAPAP